MLKKQRNKQPLAKASYNEQGKQASLLTLSSSLPPYLQQPLLSPAEAAIHSKLHCGFMMSTSSWEDETTKPAPLSTLCSWGG